MSRFIMLVFTNARAGREAEYHDWYDRHLDDVLELDGFDAAQRFETVDLDVEETAPFRYLAVYEVDGELEVARDALTEARRARDAAGNTVATFLYSSDAKEPEKRVWWYRAITDRRVADPSVQGSGTATSRSRSAGTISSPSSRM